MISAESAEARQALLSNSARLMRDGIALMRQMKKDLPTTSSGELLHRAISRVEADRVRDFLELMDLLMEMKSDQEAPQQLRQAPRQDPMTRLELQRMTRQRVPTNIANAPATRS
jgi:hypothetical protein